MTFNIIIWFKINISKIKMVYNSKKSIKDRYHRMNPSKVSPNSKTVTIITISNNNNISKYLFLKIWTNNRSTTILTFNFSNLRNRFIWINIDNLLNQMIIMIQGSIKLRELWWRVDQNRDIGWILNWGANTIQTRAMKSILVQMWQKVWPICLFSRTCSSQVVKID